MKVLKRRKGDIGYIVFLIIGIVCYFTVPSVANMVVNAGGGNPITAKATSLFGGTANSTVAASAAVAARGIGMAADALGNANFMMSQGMSKSGTNSGYFRDN